MLFIQVKDGSPINHPAFEENIVQAFGLIPSDWEPFVRTECPEVGIYDVLDSPLPVYQKINGTWMDVWLLRPMTAAEIEAKQQEVKEKWALRRQASNWAAWVFDESTCSYIPPIPRPVSPLGVIIFWCGSENNWKETPPRPEDGKQYQFDFFGWQWEEIQSV